MNSFGGGGRRDDGALPRWQTQRSAEALESQNDDAIEGIGAKVKLLKNVSLVFPSKEVGSVANLVEF